ncbi:MAG: MFS transporter [Hydrogenophaga sp.]|uniref:MFS transporter n=1 Tax=Hydrogenophaga sp. TaxID=1904254 RepID=UPI001D70C238|nr:MFS transporter [Hydrogenophaga sp.]MBX3610535.1 MFS transporter [Hydrogenophaga sp.]
MSAIHTTHATAPVAPTSTALTVLLATGAGLSVASIYYSQPMLPAIARSLGVADNAVGTIPMLTQLGYAAGILFLIPLGDRFDRRKVILAKAVLLALSLLASALAPGLPTLLAASLAVGLMATLAQDFVPAAVTLAPPEARGKAVGAVMTGLLLGILLSRVVAGGVGQVAGWRTMFVAAAVGALLLALAVRAWVPSFAPTTQLGYRALLGSMLALWRQYPLLRRAAVAQGIISLGFSAFWSTLAVMLHVRFGLGSAVAGAFGLAGAAGALAAPIAGRWSDRYGPRRVAIVGAAVAAVSFAAMAGMAWLPAGAQMALLVLCAIGFDFGVQATLIAHQSTIYSLDAEARSRLNALLFTVMFVGMSSGALLGSLALAHGGWAAITALGVLSAAGAAWWRWRG